MERHNEEKTTTQRIVSLKVSFFCRSFRNRAAKVSPPLQNEGLLATIYEQIWRFVGWKKYPGNA